MDLTLIPICNHIDHKMEHLTSLFAHDEKCNICNICNISDPVYRCENCEFSRCFNCEKLIHDENQNIMNSMKLKLDSEICKIKKTVGPDNDIIFYKKTGNIYLYNHIHKSTKRHIYNINYY